MKIASKLLAGFLFAGFSAINAYADQFCSLSVSSSVIQPGRFFSFTVNAQPGRIFPGPLDPGLGTYRVIFYGTKDGIADIPASGGIPGKNCDLWQHSPERVSKSRHRGNCRNLHPLRCIGDSTRHHVLRD
jgi:hypothetical protein